MSGPRPAARTSGDASPRHRDAERGRRRRRAPRRAAGRVARDDVHRVAGPAADDPQHVQDRRRADADGLPRRRAHAGDARAVDLRRSQRRHGLPRAPAWAMLGLELGPGGAGLRARSRTPRRSESRIPFLHFFDGFRTSHEIAKIEELTDDDMRAMIDDDAGARAPRARAVARASGHPRHGAEPRRLLPGARGGQPLLPGVPRHRRRRRWIASRALTGRQYRLFDYARPADAERVIVMMGSGAEAAEEAVERLTQRGEQRRRRQGAAVSAVRRRALRAPPCRRRVRAIAVLDRTKEPGAVGEPLYLDVVDGARRGHARPARRHSPSADDRRRPLRAVVEGVHAGDGEGGLRRDRRAAARAITSRSASWTT